MLSELLFLRYCLLGDHHLQTNDRLVCDNCLEQIPITREPHLPHVWHKSDDSPLESVCSYWTFQEQVQSLIHALKYQRKPSLGEYLGQFIATRIKLPWLSSVDRVFPVPLHPTKQRARGYNQAAAIARGVGEALSVSVDATGIVRRRFTETQTKLSRTERHENLMGAFQVHPQVTLSENETILLIDDVFTTGATLESAARSLRKKYSTTVYGLTLATAPLEA
ncbi:MAG: hypothetical protein MAGBODY4_01198 [Candidatus Marinimicrobia bacterium]|nr:hypothetical protein [Candidatus Neomarinimicrobiota bacterium]